jgi:hypothetical protein
MCIYFCEDKMKRTVQNNEEKLTKKSPKETTGKELK